MAPKTIKRPAAAGGSAMKKARGAASNPVAGQCKEVAAALDSVTGLSDSLRNMLAVSAVPALSQFKELRHSHQATVVGWIQEALTAHQSSFETSVADAKAKAETVTSEKGSCETAVAAAEEALAKLNDAAAEATSNSSNAHADVKAATAALNTAKGAQSALDTETDAATAKKEGLEAILAAESPYSKMKAEVAKKKDADAFVKTLKKQNFEQTLLQTLAPVLVKEPASRTEFDALVLNNLEEAVAQRIATQAKVIEDAAPAKQEKAAATAAAETALEAAKAAAEAADSAVKEAESAVKGGETAVKDAKKALRACVPAAKDAAAAVKATESALQEFCSGPLAAFKELQDRTAPVEEPAAEEPTDGAPEAAPDA